VRIFLVGIIGLILSEPIMAQETGAELAAKALADIKHDMELSQQQIDQVAREVDSVKKDQKSLSETLVNTVAKIAQLDDRLRLRQQRLISLLTQKTAIQDTLTAHRHEMTATLAALERMGLRPPPSILVHPDNAARALRASSLLKKVMTDLQVRMQNMRTDLAKIEQIESLIMTEKNQIESDLQQTQIEKQRLQWLLDEKKTAQNQSQQQLAALQEQNSILVHKAQSLQELVDTLEKPNLFPSLPSEVENPEQSLLIPINKNFVSQRGHLRLPVSGIKMQSFEKKKEGDFHGELYETDLGAQIITPVDGVVRYAGSFRSYGQLLILDVGQNYHLILAGMGQLHVQQGQILLAGEPVGLMATPQIANLATVQEQVAPMLYIEIRKDGIPIDPAPWWTDGA